MTNLADRTIWAVDILNIPRGVNCDWVGPVLVGIQQLEWE